MKEIQTSHLVTNPRYPGRTGEGGWYRATCIQLNVAHHECKAIVVETTSALHRPLLTVTRRSIISVTTKPFRVVYSEIEINYAINY